MRANPWFPKTLYVFLLIRWAQQQFRWPQLSGHVSLASPSSSTMSTMPQRLKRSALSMKASSHSQWQTRALRWHSCTRSVTPLFSPSSTSGHAGNCRSLIPFHSIPRSARKMFLALCSTLLCWTWAVLIQASGQSFRACRVTHNFFEPRKICLPKLLWKKTCCCPSYIQVCGLQPIVCFDLHLQPKNRGPAARDVWPLHPSKQHPFHSLHQQDFGCQWAPSDTGVSGGVHFRLQQVQ